MSDLNQLKSAAEINQRTSSIRLPSGIELIQRLNDGTIEKAPTEYLEQIRSKVSEACEELIEVGARIRPLIVDKKQIGWVRGIHNSERKILQRWVFDPNDYIVQVLMLATTLKREDVENLTALELRNLTELVKSVSEYDMSLFPYLSAFVTTSVSESLWYGKGCELSSFEKKMIELPDGATMKLLSPPDHARLWVTLCNYREQSKQRLDDNWNALLTVRPHAGKSADSLSNQLKGVTKKLQLDTLEPWGKVVKVEKTIDVNDGWAHVADDEQGILREMHGMFNNDRHEQVMAEWERQQIAQAEKTTTKIREMVAARGGVGITSESRSVMTDEEVRQRSIDLKRGMITPVKRREDTERNDSNVERMKKYQEKL
jgi:hypothetical protein